MTAHIHAQAMADYSEDALKTDRPWELWERRGPIGYDVWDSLVTHPVWGEGIEYRRKQDINLEDSPKKITPFKLLKDIDLSVAKRIKEIGLKEQMNEGRTLKDMVDGYGFRQFKHSYVHLIDIHNKLEKAKKEHGLT